MRVDPEPTPLPPFLIEAARARPGDDPIFALDAEARRRRAAGASVVNATLGALLHDDGSLAVMDAVRDAFARVPFAHAAAYAPIAGDAPFLAAVVRDAVGEDGARRAVAVATPGGTGALHHAICNFVEPGAPVLCTAHFWGPYRTICEHTGRRLRTFDTFDAGGRFHAGAMAAAMERSLDESGRAFVILNSPCHNPTGYSLDAQEWQAVTDVIEAASARGPIVVVLDLAYAKFGPDQPAVMHAVIARLARFALVIVAWSASKTFAQYGARVGAAVVVHDDERVRQSAFHALAFSCRGTWSNCNHHGLLAVTALLTDDALRARCDAERAALCDLLAQRVATWNRVAGAAGLRYPRYDGGFFVTVFVERDAAAVAAALRERDVFVVPQAGAVRVGVCAVPASDLARIVDGIAAVT